MNAICGFIFPVAMDRKSLSVKEKVASGFPSYGPNSMFKRENENNNNF